MPSTYAHRLFGEKILEHYPESIRALIQNERQLYDIGLHGPDIFFYYKVLKTDPINQIGYQTHDRPARAFFAPAKDRLDASPHRDASLAYLLGFVCHFALDSTCHGYIENKIRLSHVKHTEIESEFDRYLLEQRGIDPWKAHLTDHIVASRENAAIIAPFFAQADARAVRRALRAMIFYNRLLCAPHAPKRFLVNTTLRLSRNYAEMHGMMMAKHPIPACADSNLRLEKLFLRAQETCLSLTENYWGFLRGENALSGAFDQTFGPPPGWDSICVLSLEEEREYEL